MKKIKLCVTPDFEELESECPKTTAIHYMMGSSSELDALEEVFSFPESNSGMTPFYLMHESEKSHIIDASDRVYSAMIESLDLLFKPENHQYIEKFFSTEFVNSYPEFIEYAIHTYQNKHKAISGRFDLAYDFKNKVVTGVYEANMDSPVTYYDSVVLQHHLCKKLGNPNRQWNEHHESLVKAIPSILSGTEKRIAFLCNVNSTEDCITTETLYHAFNEEGSHIAMFDALSSLKYDYTDPRNPCFTSGGKILDAIYSLYPWEYMVEDFYSDDNNPLLNWKDWADKTKFLEPAWRYFLSNKGIFAWLTFINENLSQHDDDAHNFAIKHGKAYEYILPSYIEEPSGNSHWIKKPLLGRQSANISKISEGSETPLTDGDFINSGWLYQKYMDTGSADNGKTKAIVCAWVCPDDKSRSLGVSTKGISIREFTSPVPTYETERFVPHLIF